MTVPGTISKMSEPVLTDPAFIRRLESLYLLARKVLGGSLQADRKTTKKGSGITFADYAEYNMGDDYRSIDWRIYAKFCLLYTSPSPRDRG